MFVTLKRICSVRPTGGLLGPPITFRPHLRLHRPQGPFDREHQTAPGDAVGREGAMAGAGEWMRDIATPPVWVLREVPVWSA
jgi:hypothetical protein